MGMTSKPLTNTPRKSGTWLINDAKAGYWLEFTADPSHSRYPCGILGVLHKIIPPIGVEVEEGIFVSLE